MTTTHKWLLFITLFLASQLTYANSSIHFNLIRKGDFYVDADATVLAPINDVWAVLTDYDHLADFIPGMKASKVIKQGTEKNQPTKVVEQKGAVSFFLYSTEFALTLQVIESNHNQIDMQFLLGDMEHFEARYTLTAIDSTHTQITYHAQFKPNRFVPPLIGTNILYTQAHDQFAALITEIERRTLPPPTK